MGALVAVTTLVLIGFIINRVILYKERTKKNEKDSSNNSGN